MWIGTAKDVESDQQALCNNSSVCVCPRMNGGLIEGPPWAVKIALLRSLYLSCANITKVMSPQTIRLHADVCGDMGPAFYTITPAMVQIPSLWCCFQTQSTPWMLGMENTQRRHTLRGRREASSYRAQRYQNTTNFEHPPHITHCFPSISSLLTMIPS